MKRFNVRWDTGKEQGSNDLLLEDNLKHVGIKTSDIKEIQPFFGFPGNFYTERGVAGSNHPCCGSVGINITTNNSQNVSIQDIFYHDQGHSSGSLAGVPHWNRERRYVDINGKEKRIPSNQDHVLKDSSTIVISFVDGNGIEQKQSMKKDYSKLNSI